MSIHLEDYILKGSLLADYDVPSYDLEAASTSGSSTGLEGQMKGISVGTTYLKGLSQVFQLEVFTELNAEIYKEEALSDNYDSIHLVCNQSDLDKAVKVVSMRKIAEQSDDTKNLVYYFVCQNSFPEGQLPDDRQWGEHNIDHVSSQILSKSIQDAGLYYHEILSDFVSTRSFKYKERSLEPMQYEVQEKNADAGLCAKITGCLQFLFCIQK